MKRIVVALIALLGLTAAFVTTMSGRRALAGQTPGERAALQQAHDLSLAFQRATRLIAPSVVFVTSLEQRLQIVTVKFLNEFVNDIVVNIVTIALRQGCILSVNMTGKNTDHPCFLQFFFSPSIRFNCF